MSSNLEILGDNRGIVAGRDIKDTNLINVGDVEGSYNAIGVGAQVVINQIQQARSAIEELSAEIQLAETQLADAVASKIRKLLEAVEQSSTADRRNPYRSLLDYRLEDAPYFYGRKTAIHELLGKIHDHRLTILHADSGSGKSSLLQAGIAARLLAAGHLPLRLRPYRQPVTPFVKRAFLPNLDALPELERFRNMPLEGFLEAVTNYLGESTLYLFLDQFEEFFVELPRPSQESFAQDLADCLDESGLDVRWVLSMRKEYFSDLRLFQPRIEPFVNEYFLPTFQLAEAKDVIIEPARKHGVEYQTVSLVDQILVDLQDKDGTLQPPQVQLVCYNLFEEVRASTTPNLITADLYFRPRGRGEPGARGILSNHLSRVLNQMSAPERATARRILEALVTSQTRRERIPYNTLLAEVQHRQHTTDKTHLDRVLTQLVDSRLLRTDEDENDDAQYELAHDYLLDEIELDPETLARKAAQELLNQEVVAYRQFGTLLGQDKYEIIRSQQSHLNLDETAKALLAKSQKQIEEVQIEREREQQARIKTAERLATEQEQRARQLRSGLLAIGALLIVAVVAAWLAVIARDDAQTERDNAQHAATGEAHALSISEARGTAVAIEATRTYKQQLIAEAAATAENVARVDAEMQAATARRVQSERLALVADQISATGTGPTNNLRLLLAEAAVANTWEADGYVTVQADAALRAAVDAMPTWKLRLPLRRHAGAVNALALSPNRTYIATAGDDQTARVWYAASGLQRVLLAGHDGIVNTITFNADGSQLITGSADATVRFWDAANGNELRRFTGHSNAVNQVTISPDGQTIASASDDGSALVWRSDDGAIIHRLIGHEGAVRDVAFNPVQKTIVTAGADGTLRLWDMATGEQRQKIDAHEGGVSEVYVYPDGQMLASVGINNDLRLWHTETYTYQTILAPEEQDNLFDASDPVLAVDAAGETLAVAIHGVVKLWSTDDWTAQPAALPKPCAALAGPKTAGSDSPYDEEPIRDMVFSSDGRMLLAAREDGSISRWDLTSRQADSFGQGHVADVNTVAYSPTGDRLVTAGRDGVAIVWDAQTGVEQLRLIRHLTDAFPVCNEVGVTSANFSADGQRIVTTGLDTTVRIWDATSGEQLRMLSGHTSHVHWAEFDADGANVVSASSDKSIRLWDVATGQQRRLFEGHHGIVRRVRFSPDGTRLFSASDDGSARLWDLDTGQEIRQFRFPPIPIWGADFNADGTLVATALGALHNSMGNAAQIWNVESGALVKTLLHKEIVMAVAFAPDDSRLLTAGTPRERFRQDDTQLWDTNRWESIRGMENQQYVLGVAFHPDGQSFATAGRSGDIHLWYTELRATRLLANARAHGFQDTEDGAGTRVLITRDAPNSARLISGDTLVHLQGRHDPIRAVAFSPDGETFVTNERQIYAAAPGEVRSPLATLRVPEYAFDAVLASPDGDIVLYDWQSGMPRLVNTVTDVEITRMDLGEKTVSAAMFSADGKVLYIKDQTDATSLWNVETGAPLPNPLGTLAWNIAPLAFAPRGETYALHQMYSSDVKLINLANGETEQELSYTAGSIKAATFSPDGAIIATSGNNTAQLWSAETGEVLRTLSHEDMVTDFAFTRDGKRFVTGSIDETACIWDISTGIKRGCVEHEQGVDDVAVDAEGKYLVTFSGSSIWVWQAETLVLLHQFQPNPAALSNQFMPFKDLILFNLAGRQVVKVAGGDIWVLESGEQISAHTDAVGMDTSVAFRPDGKMIASGDQSGMIRLFDPATGLLTRQIQGDVGVITALDFTPDGTHLLAAGAAGRVGVWATETGRQFINLLGNADPVRLALLSPDARLAAIVAEDTIHLWESTTGKTLYSFALERIDLTLTANQVAFSPDGRALAAADGESVRLWDTQTGRQTHRLQLQEEIGDIAFTRDGARLRTRSGLIYDQTPTFWDLATDKPVPIREIVEEKAMAGENASNQALVSPQGWPLRHSAGISQTRLLDDDTGEEYVRLPAALPSYNYREYAQEQSITFHPTDPLMIVADARPHLRTWRTDGVQEIGYWPSYTDTVELAVFSPNGRLVATAGRDALLADDPSGPVYVGADPTRFIHLRDAETGASLWLVKAHERGIRSLSFSPDGERLLSAGWDGFAVIWDVQSGDELVRLGASGHHYWLAQYHPDGQSIAVADGSEIQFWDADLETLRYTAEDMPDSFDWFAFSRDGKMLATNGPEGVSLWDPNTGANIAFLDHDGPVYTFAFSPDSRTLLAGSSDGTRLWDLDTASVIRTLDTSPFQVTALAFSPDGKTIITRDMRELIRLWDARNGQELEPPWVYASYMSQPRISPDGKTVLALADHWMILWDRMTGQIMRRINLFDIRYLVESVRFSPDSSVIAIVESIAYETDRLHVWRVADGRKMLTAEPLSAYTINADGRLVATLGLDQATLDIWSLETGRKIYTLRDHEVAISSFTFSSTGEQLITAGLDNRVRVWTAASGEPIVEWSPGHSGAVWAAAYSPDGQVIATAGADRAVRLWNATTGALTAKLDGHEAAVHALAFHPDGELLASAGEDQTIHLWSLADGTLRNTLAGHEGSVLSLDFSANGQWLVSAGSDRTVRIWDMASMSEIQHLDGHLNQVNVARFSPDGQHIVSGSQDNTFRIWDVGSGREIYRPPGHYAAILGHTWSPDGKFLVTTGADYTARLWAVDGTELHRFDGHSAPVTAATFRPDGQILATASADRTVYLWDVASHAIVQTLSGHSGTVNHVAYSADGKRVATASSDHTIRIWDAQTGKTLTELEGHGADVSYVVFNANGDWLATFGQDETVRVWQLADGQERRRFQVEEQIESMLFLDDNATLVAVSQNGEVMIWPDIETLLAEANALIQRDPSILTGEERRVYGTE